MQNSLINIILAIIFCLGGIASQAQNFTITSDKESGACGNQQVTFEAGFIEVGTNYAFNAGRMPDDWSSSPYNLGQACSGIFSDTPDGSNYFWATINDQDGHRFVATNDLDVSVGGQITFGMRFGRDDPSSGCENPDEPSEGVYLQYSTDGGAQWSTIKYWVPTQIGILSPEGIDLYSWTQFAVTVPEAAKSNSTRFRWFQPSNSGSSYDNWGLDDISVFVLREAQTYAWNIGDGQSYTEQTLKAAFDSDGEKTISCTVVDGEGGSYTSTVNYNVIIDREAPLAQANNYFLILDEDGQANLIADYLDGGSTDNCSEIHFSVDKENFSCDDLGDNLVTLTVTDNAGNAATTTATVSVYDFTAPQVITQNITVQLDEEGNASVSAGQLDGGSSDACADTLTLTLSKTHFNKNDLGENTVILTATDKSGNQSTASAIIMVEDKVAPVGYSVNFEEELINTENQVHLAFSISGGEVGSSFAYSLNSENGGAQINGNGTIESSVQQVSPIDVSGLADGELALSLTLTDASGNSGEAAKAITQKDTSSPLVAISTEVSKLINKSFLANIHFSEPVSGFALEDIGLTNATATDLKSEDQQHFTVEIHPSTDGLSEVKIEAGIATDEAGNTNQAGTEGLKVIYDATPPTGYALQQPEAVHPGNESDFSCQFEGLETGSSLYYTIGSASTSPSITGSLAIEGEQLTISNLNVTSLADGPLEISFYLVDAAGNQGDVVKAKTTKATIKTTTTKDITSVKTFAVLHVPFATAFEALNLPKKIEVSCSGGETKEMDVVWNTGNYNPTQAGTYVLEAEIQLSTYSNSGNFKARIKVEVGQNFAPTQIKFSGNTFSPAILSEQAIGIFSTEDTDDEEHTYALVAGEGANDNHSFMIAGNELLLQSNHGLSGQTDFSIRVRSSDAYANTVEDIFILNKTPYGDGASINFVNTFSPNGDGINETWMVPELKFFNDVDITVFDRSGRKVFQTTDPEGGWDGNVNGYVQQEEYYYIITIKDIQLTKRGVLSVVK